MTLMELQKMLVPQLRTLAEKNGVVLAQRWLKPKIVEAIYNFFESEKKPSEKDYSDFLGNESESVTVEQPGESQIGSEQTIESESKRGGARDGAGRPVGSTVKAMRLERALKTEVPDENIKYGVRKISGWGKSAKVASKEVVHKASLYYTKAAEYFGVMEWLKNTPVFIFVGLVHYTIKLFNHMRGKEDDPAGKSNPDIRTQGNGQEQPGKELGPAV